MKRLLVVAYYFPPSGGPGVQRVLKFVRYLSEFGFETTVLTVKQGAYPHIDPELIAEIPTDVAIHRTRSMSPFGAYAWLTGRKKEEAVMVGTLKREGGVGEKLASWIRANIFLPDARVGWVPFAIREALKLHKAQAFDAVLTSGPPHSVHLIGRNLERRVKIPWVADFRDLWTDSNLYGELKTSAFARRHDVRLERSVLLEADRITTVSPYWMKVLAEKAGDSGSRISVIQNGFDESDFSGDEIPLHQNAGVFTLAHVGSLYEARNPAGLWNTIRDLRERGRLEKFSLQLVGGVDEGVRLAIAEAGLDDAADIVPYVSHSEAIRIMRNSHLLLLIIEEFPHYAGMITGKLYEYLASERPILGIGPPAGDASRLLERNKAGKMFSSDDTDGLAGYLLKSYEEWENGRETIGAQRSAIMQYSRREQARQLAGVLSDAIADS